MGRLHQGGEFTADLRATSGTRADLGYATPPLLVALNFLLPAGKRLLEEYKTIANSNSNKDVGSGTDVELAESGEDPP